MDKKLELHTETLRELSDDELDDVVGGERITELITTTQSPMCPSGATWFKDCG